MNRGFAALLLVITLSLSLMTALITLGDSEWLLKQDIVLLGDRTQRELAAEACRQLALLYLSEDPDYAEPITFEFDHEVSCSIKSISRMNSNLPFADRLVKISGIYKNASTTMLSIFGITNKGLIEKQRYFK